MNEELKRILYHGTIQERRALFGFDKQTIDEDVLIKFNLWSKFFFDKYFTSPDAHFHKDIDLYNLKAYREEFTFVDVAFRGASKTSRTKLFLAYAVANDFDHYRKYIKILSYEMTNSKQIVTDIYNMFVSENIKILYPEIFAKSNVKREETMGAFTTSHGVKLYADTVGTNQRGALQEYSRPDLILYEDIENRKTLRSAVITKSIWDNMEEARTSLATGGSCIYNCNYISEAGNVHKLVTKKADKKMVLIVPIIDDNLVIAWDRYTMADIELMKQTDDDYEGERLCRPSAGADILFNRVKIEEQEKMAIEPIKTDNKFKIFKEYDIAGRYVMGCDIAGGVGLDSSTSVIIDFNSFPAEVVATYADNLIKPDLLAYELQKQAKEFGGCLIAPESNNHGNSTIAILKQLRVGLYKRQPKPSKISVNPPVEYGWETNAVTKSKMLFSLADAINRGYLILNDINLILELKSYTRNDLMDKPIDPRLTTRHFDLLIACAIAFQMKDYRFMPNNQSVKVYQPNLQRDV